jgi:hypothetical protein
LKQIAIETTQYCCEFITEAIQPKRIYKYPIGVINGKTHTNQKAGIGEQYLPLRHDLLVNTGDCQHHNYQIEKQPEYIPPGGKNIAIDN